MEFHGYKDSNFKKEISSFYEVMLNPATVKHTRKVTYDHKQALGSPAAQLKYKKTPSETLSFEITIDCTGIVDSKKTDLFKEMDALEKVVYDYEGEIHKPNFVQLVWGKQVFNGVMTSMNTTYTFFKPDGTPLRAKIAFSFSNFVSVKKMERNIANKSPDLTHQVTVIEGDTLPNLCNKVWQDSKYYIQVAKFNKLNKFRRLKGGEKLIFPPIIQTQE